MAFIPDAVGIHFLIEPGEPILIHIDEHLIDYGRLLLDIGAGTNPVHGGKRTILAPVVDFVKRT